ncbi:MAG: ABC-type transport system [Rhodospirillaceae bacterium]|nr:MAG: ABC-type transport system [Rhodospirillaceae bacterium]
MATRRLFSTLMLFTVLLLPVAVFSGGQAAFAASTPAISQSEAESFVRTMSEQALQTLTRSDLSDVERARYFREVFNTTADLESIGRFVLGRYWRKATDAERTEFLKLFEDITVYTWSKRFKEYFGVGIAVAGIRPSPEEEVVVESTVTPHQGPPLLVLWKLKRSEKGIRVTDLVVEGISMAVTYRSEYGSVLQHSGGEVAGLLAALRAKADELKSHD